MLNFLEKYFQNLSDYVDYILQTSTIICFTIEINLIQ